jgi:beta-glucosidase
MRRRTCPVVIAVISLCFLLTTAPTAHAARRRSPVDRANALLAQMTRDEKISLVANGGAGIPRLAIPGLAPSDGPNGVREASPGATAFPNAVTVAASWDPRLAEEFGTALGAEASGKGFNILLGPTVNILRVPEWGRAAETFGEDPYLAGRIAAAEIRGIQSQHVIAQVKHFAANNQEIQRVGNPLGSPPLSPAVDVIVSERALREIYFPAFEAAVREGHVASVMCSYPRINGSYACQNAFLLGTLKNEWGFSGFVGPDALVAVRDTRAAIDAGTDNFQLGGAGAPPAQVLAQVPDERLDDMVRRILTALFGVGLFDHPNSGDRGSVVSTPDHQALATEIAEAGTVLLKNDAAALPLGADVRSIAVIGYDAGPGTQTAEGGSAAVVGGPIVTPLTAITTRAGQGATVTHAAGTLGVVPLTVVPGDVLTPSSGPGNGLLGTYYASMDLSGSPVDELVSSTIDATNVLAPGSYSARWTGTLTPSTSGTHRFSFRYAGDVRLYVDGRLVASGDSEGLDFLIPGAPPLSAQGTAALTAGTPASIVIEYSVGAAIVGSRLQFGWQPPDPALLAEAVTAASAADAAIVFVNDVTSEGMDRTTRSLPGDQDALVAAVAVANPRTIVVLHTAGPVLMPWLAQVAAVIEAWYPGQESGNAIAAVLFGDVDPAGRLPTTFPASEDQGPGAELAQYPGSDGAVRYDEDIDVGYRYYDRLGQAPLFPFGYGLSYTSFALDRLRVTRRHGRHRVSVRVTNTGDRAGAAVVQLYVGFPATTGEPPTQLKAFGKATLEPGKRRRVNMVLDSSSFATWSTADQRWTVEPGEYVVRIGTSSRDLIAQSAIVRR